MFYNVYNVYIKNNSNNFNYKIQNHFTIKAQVVVLHGLAIANGLY
jgi:hypothetical protein